MVGSILRHYLRQNKNNDRNSMGDFPTKWGHIYVDNDQETPLGRCIVK